MWEMSWPLDPCHGELHTGNGTILRERYNLKTASCKGGEFKTFKTKLPAIRNRAIIFEIYHAGINFSLGNISLLCLYLSNLEWQHTFCVIVCLKYVIMQFSFCFTSDYN